jgi:hypothetical protein
MDNSKQYLGYDSMSLDKNYIQESSIEELQAYADYLIQYSKIVNIMYQIKTNPEYYLSVNNRRLLQEYLINYEKGMQYVV